MTSLTLTLSLLDIAAIIQTTAGFFLAGILLASDKRAVHWIAGFSFVFALSFALSFGLSLTLGTKVYGYVYWFYWTQFTAMPLLYGYCQQIRKVSDKRLPLHFAPALVISMASAFLIFRSSNTVPAFLSQTLRWSLALQVATYSLVIIHLARRHRQALKSTISELTGFDLVWLEKMAFWLLALMLFDSVLFPIAALLDTPHQAPRFVFNLFTALYILWLSKSALNQHFSTPAQTASPSYSGSQLDDASIQQIANEVEKKTLSTQAYLKPQLTLSELSDAIGVSRHLLSEALNRGIGKNFYEYVNNHRITEAKSLLTESDQPILEIAHAVGFNNKVSFNQSFKKSTGLTPSQYRKAAIRDEMT